MYKSPIEVFKEEMKYHYDNNIVEAVQKCDIQVDKDELFKALIYDREQYEKGYHDGFIAGREKVIHCYDCKHCKVIRDNVGSATWHCKKTYGLPDVDPTDYCSHGERRESND